MDVEGIRKWGCQNEESCSGLAKARGSSLVDAS